MAERVLTVDDEVDVANAIKFLMEKEGFIVEAAYSGKACLEKVKSFKPDLVLLDIMMPDMNGWDVLKKIRAADNENVRVIFVSVMGRDEYQKHKDQKSQYSLFITKPFGKEDLLKRVLSVFGKK